MSYRIIGDWGTSRLRLFRIEDDRITDRREAPGIGVPGGPIAEVLRAAIAPWRENGPPVSIALCGMVGSRNGWVEAPYVDCPADLRGWRAGAIRLTLDETPVAIMAGLGGTNPLGAPDVMRGEETQIFGAMALDPALAEGRHLLALPGTHSKWAVVEEGCVTGFQTFFTGELFALLRDGSMLARVPADPGPAGDGFEAGLARAARGQLLGAIFEARSAQLRDGRSPAWGLAFLSGLLIGRETTEATCRNRPARVTLVGDPALAALYAQALAAIGVTTMQIDGDACARAGLLAAETMV